MNRGSSFAETSGLAALLRLSALIAKVTLLLFGEVTGHIIYKRTSHQLLTFENRSEALFPSLQLFNIIDGKRTVNVP